MWVFSQRRPFLLENDDGLSLAGQYVGRGANHAMRRYCVTDDDVIDNKYEVTQGRGALRTVRAMSKI